MKSCTSVRAMMSGVFISLVTMCACAPLNSEREDGRSYTPPPKPKQTTTVKADTSGQNGPVIGPPLPPSYKKPENPKPKAVTPAPKAEKVYYGKAVYIDNQLHGRPTASGERYDRTKFTAAHIFLPFGTICRVTNLANGRTVNVRINDRCKNVDNRVIDLSYAAAEELDAILAGVINVKIEVVKEVEYP